MAMNDIRETTDDTRERSLLAVFEPDAPKFTVDDLCKLLGWSRKTFWRHLPELPHSRVGRFIKFSEKQVREILASFERRAREAA